MYKRQEQLAEILGVAGRTVSRWENASNMPDLSILIQIAEFFDVEVKEILDGERKSENVDKELKETLTKVADYNKADKEKQLKIFVTSFLVAIIIGIITLNIQLIMFMDFRYIIGEAIILFISSITAVIMTVRNGLWGKTNQNQRTASDIIISGIISAIFTSTVAFFVYRVTEDIQKVIVCAIGFFFIVYIVGFVVLRTLSYLSKRKNKTNN